MFPEALAKLKKMSSKMLKLKRPVDKRPIHMASSILIDDSADWYSIIWNIGTEGQASTALLLHIYSALEAIITADCHHDTSSC